MKKYILSGLPSLPVILCVLPRKGGSAYGTEEKAKQKEGAE